jgi:glucose-1-phosphate thymidylyltransferase
MHALILAGGFATRLWPLTEKRAKPLLPLAGKPIVQYLVENIPAHIPIIVSTNAAFADGFTEWIARMGRSNLTLAVEDAHHDDKKLGALGAVAEWITKDAIHEDLLLLTGDNYMGFRMKDFLEAYTEGIPLVAAYDIGDREQAKAFGTVVLEAGTNRVQEFEEKPANPKTTLVSTGCSILPAATLPILQSYAAQHPDNVGGIFEELRRRGQEVTCFTFTDTWFDIGSFHAYLEATRSLVGERVLLGEGAIANENTCSGSVIIGDGSHVTKSTLKDVVLFPGSTVEDCVLERCIIDSHCTLRGVDLTGKMIRAGTELIHPALKNGKARQP